jgi:hypothetical protein
MTTLKQEINDIVEIINDDGINVVTEKSFIDICVKDKKTVCFLLERSYDLVNMIDIAIPNPSQLSINDLIKYITVEFGGQRMDSLSVKYDIKTNAALFNRQISHINGVTFIHLHL